MEHSNMRPTTPWKQAAFQKWQAVFALIPNNWRLAGPIPTAMEQKDITGDYLHHFLSPREVEITETEACDILAKTTTGIWSAREVAEAFCHRAALAHQMVYCLHEIFFEAAITDAERLDRYFADHGRPIGPLHGLPVSLKDQFHVKGVETTMGYVGWINTFEGQSGTGKERVYESEIVKELRNMGAILYCKSSVPHSLMAGETMNNIIGYTWNPRNRFLSAGGSSGGEAALIALRGSPIGIGTDIAGSIRIPAGFNGLFGLRTSTGRLPYEGVANSMDGQNSILSVVGPISTSISSLRLMMKCVLGQKPWLHDPLVIDMPWREQHYFSEYPLTFGIMRHDGFVTPHPPINRAVDIVIATIRNLGHHVVEWNPPDHVRGYSLAKDIFTFDGGLDIHECLALSGEPIAPRVALTFKDKPFGQRNAAFIAATNVAKRNYQKEYLEYWNSTASITHTGLPVDAFIMPIAAISAVRPKSHNFHVYTSVINVLDYAACAFPVTHASQSLDNVRQDFTPISNADAENHMIYDAALYDGTPVGLQLVGRRLEEEKVLALTELIAGSIASTYI